ncbi:MAG: hypothetical protein H0W23_01160 [Chloroflexia bacterium]|nr:hypothetical protein [Chloroflexia bacterium]
MSPDPERDPDGNGSRGLIVVMSGDVFFGMRIRTALRLLGYDLAINGDPVSFSSALASDEPRAELGLIDFNRPVDWSLLVDALAGPVPVIAFGPHMDVAGFRAAKEAGVTRAVANGEFSRSLPDLVARHARTPQP